MPITGRERRQFNDLIYKTMSKSEISEMALAPLSEIEDLVALGQKSENEMGLVLRSVQIGLATSFCSTLSAQHAQMQESLGVLAKMNEKINADLAETLPSMDVTDVLELRETMEKSIYRQMEMERKIIQGRGLFPDDSLSDEDRKVLRLMATLQSPEDKARFMRMVEREFGPENSYGGSAAGAVDSAESEVTEEIKVAEPKPRRSKFAKMADAEEAKEVMHGDIASAVNQDVAGMPAEGFIGQSAPVAEETKEFDAPSTPAPAPAPTFPGSTIIEPTSSMQQEEVVYQAPEEEDEFAGM